MGIVFVNLELGSNQSILLLWNGFTIYETAVPVVLMTCNYILNPYTIKLDYIRMTGFFHGGAGCLFCRGVLNRFTATSMTLWKIWDIYRSTEQVTSLSVLKKARLTSDKQCPSCIRTPLATPICQRVWNIESDIYTLQIYVRTWWLKLVRAITPTILWADASVMLYMPILSTYGALTLMLPSLRGINSFLEWVGGGSCVTYLTNSPVIVKRQNPVIRLLECVRWLWKTLHINNFTVFWHAEYFDL